MIIARALMLFSFMERFISLIVFIFPLATSLRTTAKIGELAVGKVLKVFCEVSQSKF